MIARRSGGWESSRERSLKVCISIDMDNHQEYRSLIDPEGAGGHSFYRDALPRFLEVLDRHRVHATFFMIGRDGLVPEHREVAREVVRRGHEVGNHSHTHPYNFASLTREQKLAEITNAEEAIADATGERPRGFRTPSCDVDDETVELLAERGYVYDASTFPSPLMLLFMLYGKLFVKHESYQLGPMATMLAPRDPYHPSRERFYRPWRPGQLPGPPIVEMPLSVVPILRIPFYATLLRLLGPGLFRRCVRLYGRRRPMLQMAFHLMDLVDLSGTSLGQAVSQSPGLAVPFERRERFVDAAIEALSRTGESATLREIAREHAVAHPVAVAAS
jgi:peptidoglycan/xylan/chitin deacetylase (PgdA/CDA1 family)